MAEVEKLKNKLALQTWTIRHLLRTNVKKVLRDIRRMGFTHLEVAGTGRKSAKEFSDICRDHGVTIIGNHEPSLTSGDFDVLIQEMKIRCGDFNTKQVTVMLDPFDRGRVESYIKYAELCRRAGEMLALDGIKLCYHCYHFDLSALQKNADLRSGLDILLEETTADQLSIVLDTYFIQKAAISADSVFAKCGCRCKILHLCDISKEGKRETVGKGIVRWPEVIKSVRKHCSPEWYVIENDTREPMKSIRQSYLYCCMHLL